MHVEKAFAQNITRSLLYYLKLRVVVHLNEDDVGGAAIELIRQGVQIPRLEVGCALLLHDLRLVRQNLLCELYNKKQDGLEVSA